MPALSQMAGTKSQLINNNLAQKKHKEPAPGICIHITKFGSLNNLLQKGLLVNLIKEGGNESEKKRLSLLK